MGRSRSLNKLFNEAEGGLAKVIAKTEALASIADKVTAAIPTLLQGQVWLGDIRDHTLTVICSSNVIANRLRFMEYQLLNELSGQHGLGEINQLRVKVNRDWRADTAVALPGAKNNLSDPFQQTQRLSDSSAELIEQTSNCVRNPKLAEALKSLANRSATTTDD